MLRLRLGVVVPMLTVLALVSTGGHAAETKTVVIEGMAFQPATLTVKQGDTVVWKNADLYAHTATAAGAFDSKEIAPGGTWKLIAQKQGRFPYVCTLHPVMKGTLVVK